MEASALSVQWFPGHMAKTRRLMRDHLRFVDLVVELRDARIPNASSNPEIDKLLNNKPRILLLNKSDMADPEMTQRWISFYQKQGIPVLAMDCRSGKGLKSFAPLVQKTLSALLERRRAKGMIGQPVRIMIVGVPNVGKSSLINRLAGSKRAKVEDRPGVTRGKQWVKIDAGMELLDMPGVLWPKFEDPRVGELLAFTGAVKDDILDIETLAMRLLETLALNSSPLLVSRYKLDEAQLTGSDMLAAIGRKRGMLLPGNEVNLERAAITLIDEFRSGAIGRITLEAPPEMEGVAP